MAARSKSPPTLRVGVAVAIAIGGLMAVTQSQAQSPPAEPSVAESTRLGRALVLRNCGMCHAVGRSDVSTQPQAPAFRDLNRRMDVDALGEGLATGILTQHPAMPEFRFQPNEVVAIIRYLRSLQGRSRAAAESQWPTPPG